MADPVTVDIPHKLGLEGARARIENGVGKLAGMFPGGTVVEQHWEGDSLSFTVQAMGQKVASRLELFEDRVHAELDLPPFLRMFADKIRGKLQKDGPALLK
ncbi:polyhydroxyalkanoic acid system family protein [Sphingomonas sp. 3-13AW]|uniref:polyhydroxyalkanoic acid system family protein n=1 Tax=Sphingomonas sp. 3-13AW TaxID=3050450 RepID=UPI003BB51DDF